MNTLGQQEVSTRTPELKRRRAYTSAFQVLTKGKNSAEIHIHTVHAYTEKSLQQDCNLKAQSGYTALKLF